MTDDEMVKSQINIVFAFAVVSTLAFLFGLWCGIEVYANG